MKNAKADADYLRQIVSTRAEGYSDWSNDQEAYAACKRLEAEGYCRVVWESEGAWRVYQSSIQHTAAIRASAEGDGA